MFLCLDTRTFVVESQIPNPNGSVKDGLTANMTIEIDKVMAHKISPSILLLNDEGKLGIRVVTENDTGIIFSHNSDT